MVYELEITFASGITGCYYRFLIREEILRDRTSLTLSLRRLPKGLRRAGDSITASPPARLGEAPQGGFFYSKRAFIFNSFVTTLFSDKSFCSKIFSLCKGVHAAGVRAFRGGSAP
jgi:hypothetical protein